MAIPLHIGSGVKLVDDESTAGFLTSQTAPLDQVILNFFPKNIVGDLSGNRVVPIIITATVLAIAIVSVGRQKDVSVVKRFFEQTKGVIYKAVGYVSSSPRTRWWCWERPRRPRPHPRRTRCSRC